VNYVLVRDRVSALLPRRADLAAAGRRPRQNVIAGITVAVVALPLALAFGVASGLGAQAGLATAVVAGAVAAVFGGSNLQVSGPTGAMTVVLIPITHQFGPSGVLMVGAMAGVLLIVMAGARIGQYVRYLPLPVVEGFTAGIAVVIALQQVPAALGVADAHGDRVWVIAADAARLFVRDPQVLPLLVALGVAAIMLVGARWHPTAPYSLLAVAAATGLSILLPGRLTSLGSLPAGLPRPSLAFANLSAVSPLATAAIAVAALAALESLLSATVADAMSVNEQHDPDRELFGQGLANLAAPLFGGIPATAAIARTAVNVRAGASSKLAALTHSLVLLVVVLTIAPLVSRIPLAALAGVLFATTVRMVEVSSLRAIARATRGDALILVLTFSITVAVDLVTAVIAGLGVAVLLALRSVARTARLEPVPLELGDHSAQEHALLREHIVAYRLDGPLFFAAAHHFLLELSDVADVRVVILRMSRISAIDATGAHVLADAISRLERRGITVLLSGISTRHDGVLTALGVGAHLRRDGLIFPDTPAAIGYARSLLRTHLRTPLGTPTRHRNATTGAAPAHGSASARGSSAGTEALTAPAVAVLRGERARQALAGRLRGDERDGG
jgi:SulP family sulfate permease